jgi:S-adenosylmethionine decarboxylase proenzyme
MQGLHLTADLYECRCARELLTNCGLLRATLLDAVRASGLTGVAQLFHDFSAQGGEGSGVTGVVLLAESHVAVHTWPEREAVTLDVYVCNYSADNTAKAHALFGALQTAFAARRQQTHALARGAQ